MSSSKSAAGAFGLIVGACTLAAGVGLLPHLATGALTAGGVVAVVCLVAGLGILVTIGAAIWLPRGWPSRLLLVTCTVVLVGVALITVGQAVAATVVPRPAIGTTPAGMGLAYIDVRPVTADGVELAGWYVPSRNGAAVVLLHGAGSTRSSVLDQAKVLSSRGYGVLLIDARGHGGSAGRAMDFGWCGDLDVRAAVDVLSARSDVTAGRIAAVGISMGGEEAIGAMAADARVRAVVAEGATNRVAADKEWLAEKYGVRGRLQQQLDRLTYALADVLTPASPPTPLRAAIAMAAPRRTLLIAAAGRPDEGYASAYLRAASPQSVQVWVAPGGHAAALASARVEWTNRVGAFLDEVLAPHAAHAA
jgi:pimeloyl-ACP methyl ester carboxylesterase